jgi:hypothetical protein
MHNVRGGISSTLRNLYKLIRLVTGCTVRGSNSGGGQVFRTRPDRPWGPPSLLYNGYRSLPGVKRPDRGADHPPSPSAEVENE